MGSRGWRSAKVLASVLLMALRGEGVARAEEAATQSTASPVYTLEVDTDAPETISFDALAPQLAGDLGAPVVRAAPSPRAAISVSYRASTRALTVHVTRANGGALERKVIAEGEADDVQREAVLLGGNLARDEASELLEGFAAKQPKSAPPATPAGRASDAVQEDLGSVPVSVGVVYPLATNSGRPDLGSAFDLSLAYGRVGRASAVQIGGGAVHASRGFTGWQCAGALTIAGRDAAGVQLAGGAGLVFGDLGGAQVTGGANIARDVHGAQVTGVFNLARDLTGAQLSAGANIARGSASGLQASGGVNLAEDLAGAQLTGAANVARDVRGTQIAIVNVGRRVDGLQLGVVNVAEEADAAVGLVSVTKGGVRPFAWVSNLAYVNAGFMFRSRYVYTSLAATTGTYELEFDSVGGTAALGTRIDLPAAFDVSAEGAASFILRTDKRNEENFAVHPRLIVGYSVAPHFRLFAGGGARIPTRFDSGRSVVRPEAFAGMSF